MMTVINSLKTAAHKRAAYYRTIAELEAMPLDVAIDLDIYKPHARKIAYEAVYGA